ncbi:hypothetical protein QQY66_34120 [Streptomyces sp. DG2A-72]|uniref:hypothetical protein n=1 Tax=Streptomyces sp. DG2A-72 TaxID=3051386 RepID=UPI00265C5918|nr:hypothetical protein [Streptomyces sp. DG2A-72]MDO0936497.1 hypothetical protein [Streptomyces sp. DG2A-72]
MRLVMSDDYAALVSGVIAVVLVLGFVEFSSFQKHGFEQGQAMVSELEEAETDALQSMRAGVGPSPEQLARVSEARVRARAQVLPRVVGPLALSLLWVLLSSVLAITECLVICWAAIDGHGPAPWLAKLSLYASATGIVALLIGALHRALMLPRLQLPPSERTDEASEELRIRLSVYQEQHRGRL